MRIGFIGLGTMGASMVGNLLKGGYSVTAWDRIPRLVTETAKAGAGAATSAKDAARRSDVTITMVTDTPDVEEVILGPDGVIDGTAPDSVVVDMSTISPGVSRSISQTLREKGVHMLDAPVSGGPQGAVDATLSIMVGGDREIFERCAPIFEKLGSRITLCGGSGMGASAKLGNQIIGLGNVASLCEGVAFAVRAGVDPAAFIRAIGGGAASGSWMADTLGPKILDGDFDTGSKVSIVDKDLRLVVDAAGEMRLPLFTTPLVKSLYDAAVQMGMGDKGIQAYLQVLMHLAGMEEGFPKPAPEA